MPKAAKHGGTEVYTLPGPRSRFGRDVRVSVLAGATRYSAGCANTWTKQIETPNKAQTDRGGGRGGSVTEPNRHCCCPPPPPGVRRHAASRGVVSSPPLFHLVATDAMGRNRVPPSGKPLLSFGSCSDVTQRNKSKMSFTSQLWSPRLSCLDVPCNEITNCRLNTTVAALLHLDVSSNRHQLTDSRSALLHLETH